MKINPGGKLSLEDIVGRDPLFARIIQDPGGQSIILVAERRMGKTHVLDKLVAAVPSGWVMLKRDVEGVRPALEDRARHSLLITAELLTRFPAPAYMAILRCGIAVGIGESSKWIQALLDQFLRWPRTRPTRAFR